MANLSIPMQAILGLFKVSVPLRGKYRGKSAENIQEMLLMFFTFPSPCGVNIVANGDRHCNQWTRRNSKVSVPLRGKYRGKY